MFTLTQTYTPMGVMGARFVGKSPYFLEVVKGTYIPKTAATFSELEAYYNQLWC